MTRLPPLDPENLTPDQQAVYDAMRQGPRGDLGLVGPFGVWARSPSVGNTIQQFGADMRFATTSISETVKEVAICTVGAHFRAKFEFAAHRALAMRAGVTETVVDGIRAGNPEFNDADQALAFAITRGLLDENRINDELFNQAIDAWGENGLIELTSVIGYYCLVSLTLNVFEVPLSPGMADPFPELP